MAKKLNIGLFGFGCVGQGLYHVLNNSKGFTANISRIAVRDKNKQRSLPQEIFTFNKYDILDDPEINVVVELIDDAEEAFEIVKYAIQKGKHVVTANKKLVATHLNELYELQEKHGVSLLYEASTCGSIPIIRTLEEYFDNEQLNKVSGIFNGTTNYILTKTINDKISYSEALKEAQLKGFAETNPASDVEGFDPKYKAVIIALHAFGVFAKPDDVLNIGITTLHENDINYAAEKGYKIKLVPTIKQINKEIGIFVLPKFIKQQNPLYFVDNEFNGVVVEGEFSGEQFLKGKGAGGHPTGAAVLSDISALSYDYKYAFKKLNQPFRSAVTNNILIKVYIRYNSIVDLQTLELENITEQYSGENYNYAIGIVNVNTLLLQRDFILKNNIFISELPEEVSANLKPASQLQGATEGIN
jgi:homoserine dehydrogenase